MDAPDDDRWVLASRGGIWVAAWFDQGNEEDFWHVFGEDGYEVLKENGHDMIWREQPPDRIVPVGECSGDAPEIEETPSGWRFRVTQTDQGIWVDALGEVFHATIPRFDPSNASFQHEAPDVAWAKIGRMLVEHIRSKCKPAEIGGVMQVVGGGDGPWAMWETHWRDLGFQPGDGVLLWDASDSQWDECLCGVLEEHEIYRRIPASPSAAWSEESIQRFEHDEDEDDDDDEDDDS